MFDSKNQSNLKFWVLLLALAAVGCANPAADAPQAVVEETAPAGDDGGEAAPDAAGESLAITDKSTIGFVGSKVTGSHDGGFKKFSGTVFLVDDDPTKSKVEVKIDTTSLWSDNERLTTHLKSADFFEVEKYPTSTFESTSIVPGEGDNYTITGNLNLHGVTKKISFPAEIHVGDHGVHAAAEFAIKRFDFGIVYKGKADDLIRDDVLIKLDLVAAHAAA